MSQKICKREEGKKIFLFPLQVKFAALPTFGGVGVDFTEIILLTKHTKQYCQHSGRVKSGGYKKLALK